MKKIITPYLLIILAITVIFGLSIFCKRIDFKNPLLETAAYCLLFGMLGGIIYCIRGYYQHHSVLKNWDSSWEAWYFIRPIVSGVMGFISLVFIKAGLLVFASDSNISVEGNKIIAYFAVAFIAGYNVQNFLVKLEDIFSVILGIEKKVLPK